MKENYKELKGFLVVNKFLNSQKFNEIYDWLQRAARGFGIVLDYVDNASIVTENCLDFYAENYDFCLFWDKDILLARALMNKGLRVFNTADAIEICDDKMLTFNVLKDSGILMPKTLRIPFTYDNIGYNDFSFVEAIAEELKYPFIIKETKGSFGAQVYMAGNQNEAVSILKKIGGRAALAQEFITESCGRDLRINMVGQEACAAMERHHISDFRANVTNGGSMSQHQVTNEEIKVAQRVMEVIGLDFAGVDILFSKNGPMLCEVNSNAHFKNIFDCTGVNIADRIMEYIYARMDSIR